MTRSVLVKEVSDLMKKFFALAGLWLCLCPLAASAAPAAALSTPQAAQPAHVTAATRFAVVHTPAEWKKLLTPPQYYILRDRGTEEPGSGKYNDFWKHGTYVCAACGQPLFSSDTKYDPHEGWPSFWAPISKTAVLTTADHSLGMDRDEVVCARCGGHLGHLFDDGPVPTGLRFCMDSDALVFVPAGTKLPPLAKPTH
jgi:peptide-methionine (R)-S-oxide reductase